MAEAEGQQAAHFSFPGTGDERLKNARAGAPGDVEARHRIAVAHRVIAAAFSPADNRKAAMPHGVQPAALFPGGEAEIGLGPAARPVVLGPVEPRRSEPVLPGEVEAVFDTEPALFGRIDEEQSAERPERLTAEALLALLVDHDDFLAGVGDLGCGDEAGKTRAHHDHVRGNIHRIPLCKPTWSSGV